MKWNCRIWQRSTVEKTCSGIILDLIANLCLVLCLYDGNFIGKMTARGGLKLLFLFNLLAGRKQTSRHSRPEIPVPNPVWTVYFKPSVKGKLILFVPKMKDIDDFFCCRSSLQVPCNLIIFCENNSFPLQIQNRNLWLIIN